MRGTHPPCAATDERNLAVDASHAVFSFVVVVRTN
jgi:hypothetical protein